jgi:hypothetical protein
LPNQPRCEELFDHVAQRLTNAKACTVFETDLERVWPRMKFEHEKREAAIQAFALRNGWTATVLNPGIRVTFRKAVA